MRAREIAATFNTPIGGVLFATELMLPEISVDTFLPVAIATGSATFLGRLFWRATGVHSAFQPRLTANQPSSVLTLLLYVVSGAIIGAAAALLIRSLHWLEDGFDRIPGRYLRHMLGMLVVGVYHLRAMALGRPLLRRGRWLFDDPGRAG